MSLFMYFLLVFVVFIVFVFYNFPVRKWFDLVGEIFYAGRCHSMDPIRFSAVPILYGLGKSPICLWFC